MSFYSNLMFSSSLCFPTHITFVLSRFIFRPCFLNMSFHSSSAPCNSSRCSATITRSSAYIIFLRASVVLIFLLISSITMMKSNGLRALPCLDVHLELIRHSWSYYYSCFGVLIHCFNHFHFWLWCSHPSQSSHCHSSRDSVKGFF